MDVERFSEARDVKDLLLDPGEAIRGRIVRVSVLAESLGKGQAKKVRGLHQSAEREGIEVAAGHGGSQEAIEEGGRGTHC